MLTESILLPGESQWDDDASRLAQSNHRINICGSGDRGRAEAEAFVRGRFRETHGARIETFMPSLMALKDRSGTLCAVAGWRDASDGGLFLERYLAQPIEAAIAARCHSEVRRKEVVEVGNFACANVRAARALIGTLSFFLLEENFCWIAFTATRRIRTILEQMTIGCLDLGPADGACAANCLDDWGRYYQTEPHVMVGFLPMARGIPSLRVANAD